jgi:transcriptional regulator with XRE-family HTH domain
MRNIGIDFQRLVSELVRVLRGTRSQPALSRRLGFKTNVVYFWESGRRHPSITQLLELAKRAGVDLAQSFRCIYPVTAPDWLLAAPSLSDREIVARFLSEARGATPLVHLTERTGFSRFALARWIGGDAEPRAWEFLAVVHHSTHRLVDYLEPFVGNKKLPALESERERVHAARRVAERFPMSQVLLRCLELESSRRSGKVSFATTLGISSAQEQEMLALLEATGQIARGPEGWQLLRASPLDMRLHRETAHLHRAFWADVARKRAPTSRDGLCAYNVCGVSREGFAELRRLQREYLQKARALIEKSEPVERVALLQVNLVALVDDELSA